MPSLLALPDLTGTPVSFVVSPIFLDRIASDIATRLDTMPGLEAAIQLAAQQALDAVDGGLIETVAEALARFAVTTAENMRAIDETERTTRLLAISLIRESVR